MANNAQIPVGVQPDFAFMSQSYYALGNEVAKIPNTPQFALGNDILARLDQINTSVRQVNDRLDTAVRQLNDRLDTAVRQLNDRLDTAVQQLNDKIDTAVGRLDTAVERLDTTIQASNHNNVARLSNSFLVESDGTLAELVNPSNNTEVAGFPETPGHIGTMQTVTLNEVLRELGLAVRGSRLAKEQRLRLFIGLRRNPA